MTRFRDNNIQYINMLSLHPLILTALGPVRNLRPLSGLDDCGCGGCPG